MWVSLQGHRNVGQPIELLNTQDKVRGGNSQGPCTETGTGQHKHVWLQPPAGYYSQAPHLELRGESVPHCCRVFRCGWWEKWG